jgi:tripartite ATP-independent transporter DctP family solute receptor
MKKTLTALLAVSMVTGSLAGCGKTVTVETTAAPAETTKAAEAAAAETNAAETQASTDPAVTIILGNFCAEGEPGQNASLLFAEKANEYSNGSITVEVHNKSELGNAPEMAEQVSLGAIQACLVCEATLDKYDIRYALVPMPYMYDSYEQAYKVVDGPFKEWVNDGTLESKGLHDVGSWDYGFRNITNSQHPIEHPADVQGLKIRTPSEIQLTACMEALGADVQQVAFSELITALKQKTVDGQENPISTIYNNSLWECEQHYLTMSRHQWESMNLILNNDFWESLTDAQRDAIQKASDEASASMRAEVQSSENDYIQKCKDKGMEVIEDIDISEFQAAMGPAYEQMAEYVGDQALIDKMLEIRDSVK